MCTTVDATPYMRSDLKYCALGYRGDILNKNHLADKSRYKTFVYLGWKESSLTIHCFFSGTCFQVTGSARSTRAFALRRPKPKRLLTISPAPFLFQPGLLAKGSNSEVQTTMCCRSLQLRSGLREGRRTRSTHFWLHWKCLMQIVSHRSGSAVAYFCSSARANIPAARGAEADVPVWVWVHSLCRSALVWKQAGKMWI